MNKFNLSKFKEVLQIENKNRKICKKERRQPKILKDLREYKVLKAKTKQATADFCLKVSLFHHFF